jgi:hypothetical protein
VVRKPYPPEGVSESSNLSATARSLHVGDDVLTNSVKIDSFCPEYDIKLLIFIKRLEKKIKFDFS